MHIAIAGLTSLQRALFVGNKREDKGIGMKPVRDHNKQMHQRSYLANLAWTEESSLNNLHDVHQLYCPNEAPLQKETRDTFVKGNMGSVRQNFQELMKYCCADVKATHSVYKTLFSEFKERFQNPVTLAGMLELSTAYLPINQNWEKYIDASNTTYDKILNNMKTSLMKVADDNLKWSEDDKFKNDVWLWDLEWKPKNVRTVPNFDPKDAEFLAGVGKTQVKIKQYPTWYANLCPIIREFSEKMPPGRPTKISTQMRVTPKLLRLTWKGYPLHYHEEHKWGYLVPQTDCCVDSLEKELLEQYATQEPAADDGKKKSKPDTKPQTPFPIRAFFEYCSSAILGDAASTGSQLDSDTMTISQLERQLQAATDSFDKCLDEATLISLLREINSIERELRTTKKIDSKKRKQKSSNSNDDTGISIDIPGVIFHRLPHKNGAGNAVGNPLSKDSLFRIDDGTLKSAIEDMPINESLKDSSVISYWKSNQKRIEDQMRVTLPKEHVLRNDTNVTGDDDTYVGAIVPRLVTAGTVTRRAVESTWLTASNAYEDRVGSELKAMIQSPPGYCFVGADVDSQELWIAAIIGDAHFGGVHGCTAFGWMTLQGTKKEGTDLHSKTASLVGISRDHAKVFNYGRIYGAGEKFARQLLMQFNQNLTMEEAVQKARSMYLATKGKKRRFYDKSDDVTTDGSRSVDKWHGGTESAMFNKLEAIARSPCPRTPALGACISKALEPQNVSEDFITSRINWVVQSSGVDYLHLILVCMKWLFTEYNIDGRFSISIHDEVRYMVKEEDKYRAALALQISNLLTRSLFAYRLGMNDLPQSVAFFSAVDIDQCLRKEVYMDCKTPSNPLGLEKGYGIGPGEALDIHAIIEKTGGSLCRRDN